MSYPKPLNSQEKQIFDVFLKIYLSGPPSYILHSDVRSALKNISARQFAGYCSSLEKKGWLYAFSDICRDMEITCMALKASGVLKKKRTGCNHIECFCHK